MSFMRARPAGLAHSSSTVSARPAPSVARPRNVSRASTGGSNKSVDEMLAEANALLNAVSSGVPGAAAVAAAGASGVLQSIDELEQLGFVCDESGCVLVLPTAEPDADASAKSLTTFVQGRGWGLGTLDDPDDADFPALVTGPGWAVPLTAGELADLISVTRELRGAVQALHTQGQWLSAAGDRPVSRAKWNSRQITMQATWAAGDAQPAFSLELTFRTGGRSITALWPAEAAAAVCECVVGNGGGGAAAEAAPAQAARTIAAA